MLLKDEMTERCEKCSSVQDYPTICKCDEKTRKPRRKMSPSPPQKKQNKHNKERNKACDEPDEKNMN